MRLSIVFSNSALHRLFGFFYGSVVAEKLVLRLYEAVGEKKSWLSNGYVVNLYDSGAI